VIAYNVEPIPGLKFQVRWREGKGASNVTQVVL
jgi:hypothetical protein